MLKEKMKQLNAQIAEKRTAVNTQVDEAKTRANEGDLEAAKAIKSAIETLKTEIAALETELADLEEIDGLEQSEENKQGEGEKRGMPKQKEFLKSMDKEIRSFETYIRTKGAETRDLNTTNGAVFVPKDVVNEVFELKENELDLANLTTVQPVSTGAGSFPVAKRNAGTLKTKEELAAMETVAEDMFIEVNYKVETRAGQIALSNELVEDSAVDVLAHVKKQLRKMVKNTNNVNIIAKLKTFTKVAASTVDDLKKVYNVDLDPALQKSVLTNQTGYNYLDTLKDADGKYLLQPNLSAPTGKGLFGAPIHVVSDSMLAATGSKHPIIIGDIEEAVAVFNRTQVEVQWEKFDSYSQGLAVVVRNDYQEVDADAARYIELTPPPAA